MKKIFLFISALILINSVFAQPVSCKYFAGTLWNGSLNVGNGDDGKPKTYALHLEIDQAIPSTKYPNRYDLTGYMQVSDITTKKVLLSESFDKANTYCSDPGNQQANVLIFNVPDHKIWLLAEDEISASHINIEGTYGGGGAGGDVYIDN